MQQLRLGGIGEERREIILPQHQEAAGEVGSVAHRTPYRMEPRQRKPPRRRGRLFDEAIVPKHCIVAEGDPLAAETSRT